MTDDKKIDFIGIGAAKSGSSWLAECLRQHPDILFPGMSAVTKKYKKLEGWTLKDGKELVFFTRGIYHPDHHTKGNYFRGIDWYLGKFPPAQPGKIRGEFSPDYISDPESSTLIHGTFPDVKLLVVLREPSAAIYSMYWFNRALSLRVDSRSFEEDIDRGLFLERGRYFEKLKKYYDLFPHANIKVVLSDDIRSDPKQVIREMYEFLGVRNDFLPPNLENRVNSSLKIKSQSLLRLVNKISGLLRGHGFERLADRMSKNRLLYNLYCRLNLKPGKYPPMKPETGKKLRAYFRDDILKLQELIGRDLSAWL